jgi:diguanylate cyclase (GGDEF)-like protein
MATASSIAVSSSPRSVQITQLPRGEADSEVVMLTSRMPAHGGSARRLFALYAAVTLVPVLLLGSMLLSLLNSQGDAHGIAVGRTKADLIARTSIAPLLDGADLGASLPPAERAALSRTVALAVNGGDVLRLRLRDLRGTIVLSDDGSRGGADDEALAAASGRTVAHLTWLNADASDEGPRGPRVVEVYQPLAAVQSGARIGVLEMYLPYAPIAADISRGQRTVSLALGAGLLLLWLCLLAVSCSVAGRLHRHASANAFLASHDPLTGLPNRSRFAERAEFATIAAAHRRATAIAVIDLDRFKEINDTLGHGNGDQLLVELADRLKLHMREDDTVARLGGDEFGVILRAVHGAGETVEILSRLRAVIAEPLMINGLPLTIEASIGFALAPEDGNDVGTLLQRADVAMYVAKRQRLGVVHYRPQHDQYDSSALTLVAELGTAIAHDQLLLHYQPKGDLQQGTVTAVEALVRWQHPSRGLLYPDAFLPAAEQTELIDQLTRWVLTAATSALPDLDPTGTLAVAVNISARSLVRADFAGEVLALLAETRTDPHRVILEITETALLADPARAAATLSRLHEAGLRISIDDFGAGQTSLGYLAMLPITELKIDKAFVLAMLSDERNAAIVRSVIELGHSLGFTVTAEGVETPDALAHLTSYRCDTVQGYLISRPVAGAEIQGRLSVACAVLEANHRDTPAAAAELAHSG